MSTVCTARYIFRTSPSNKPKNYFNPKPVLFSPSHAKVALSCFTSRGVTMVFGRSGNVGDQFLSIDSSDSDLEPNATTDCDRETRRGRDRSRTKSRDRSQSKARSIASVGFNKMMNLAQEAVSPRRARGRYRNKPTKDELGESQGSRSSNGNIEMDEGSQTSSPIRPPLLSPPSILHLDDGHSDHGKTVNSVAKDPQQSPSQTSRSSSPTKRGTEKPAKHHDSSSLCFNDNNPESPRKNSKETVRKQLDKSKESNRGRSSPKSEFRQAGTSRTRGKQKHPDHLEAGSPRHKEDLPKTPRNKRQSRSRYDNIVKDAEQWRTQFQHGSPLSRKLERARSISISEHGDPKLGTDDMRSVSRTVIGLVTPGRTKRGTFNRVAKDSASVPGIPKLLEKEGRGRRRRNPESPRHRSKSRVSRTSAKSRREDQSLEAGVSSHSTTTEKKKKKTRSSPSKKHASSHRELSYQRSKTPTKDHAPDSASIVSSRSRRSVHEQCPETPSLTPEKTVDSEQCCRSAKSAPMTPASCGKQRASVLSREVKEGLLAGIKKELEPDEEPVPKTPTKPVGLLGLRSKSAGRRTPQKGSKTPKVLKGIATPSRREAGRCALDESQLSKLRLKSQLPTDQQEKFVDLRNHITRAVSTNSLSAKTKESGRTRLRIRKKHRDPSDSQKAAQLSLEASANKNLDVEFLAT